MQIPQHEEHPVKKQIHELDLRIWQVAKMSGTSLSYLSQVLNGILPMPKKLERKLQNIVDEVRRDQQQAVAG